MIWQIFVVNSDETITSVLERAASVSIHNRLAIQNGHWEYSEKFSEIRILYLPE